MENSIAVPQKTKTRSTIGSNYPLSGWEMKSVYQRDSCTLMFIVALFTITKLCSQSMFQKTDEWKQKICFIYIYIYTTEYY
jgi:hypothetical protein